MMKAKGKRQRVKGEARRSGFARRFVAAHHLASRVRLVAAHHFVSLPLVVSLRASRVRLRSLSRLGSRLVSRPRRVSHFCLFTFAFLLLTVALVCARRAVAENETRDDDGGRVSAVASDEVSTEIESALYTRAEFFGARALVPYPTAEARVRLDAVRAKYPEAAQVYLRLAQLDERLGRYAGAEENLRAYVARAGGTLEASDELANFLHRRGEYAREAATLESMLQSAPPEERARLLERLMRLAKSQRLDDYLQPEFYQRAVSDNAEVFEVVRWYLERLVEEENYTAALAAIRQYAPQFASHGRDFLKLETTTLVAAGRAREAERVYVAAFDPFWPEDLSREFYEFLSNHERLRAYGHELREAFKRRPADYDLAVRLFHFRKHAYEEAAPVLLQLERARAAEGIAWQPSELATVARLLIREGDGDAASRFLYTLHVEGRMERGGELRAKVLYQLFELLSDAGERRLALTRGELQFYRDIAGADPHPGMLGGVLSLIFSDTNPQSEMRKEEETAVKHFNRAAAFRIFDAYRREYPTSPELAQMYLDIVRLYTATGEPQVASETLAEFERRYADAPQYPQVALKLADCYLLLKRHEEERALYQRVLDHLGARRAKDAPLFPAPAHARNDASGAQADERAFFSEPTEHQPATTVYPPKSNKGIRVPDEDAEDASEYYYDPPPTFRDFVSPVAADNNTGGDDDDDETESGETPETQVERVAYADVLARYVASLAQQNRTQEILALYGNEIKKYPQEQRLYEQLLEWLGQTNLTEEQLRVYRETLKQFPTTLWRDRLARWFLRRERREEFAEYSRELLEGLGDRETESYLERFVAARATAGADNLDAKLYLGLYTLAHERFPHNLYFVRGLLKFYAEQKRWTEWQALMAEYYFASGDIREQFLSHLAATHELRERLETARLKIVECDGCAEVSGVAALPYKLFRADAAVRLSNYEEAIDAYRELNRLYPHTPEFAERLVAFTRSLGQHNPRFLEEAASVAQDLAGAFPESAAYRTRAGEIFAELGDYTRARGEWSQLLAHRRGEAETYLEAATLYWDYYQYADALQTIETLRRELNRPALYAFQAGAILEAQHKLPAALAEYLRALDEDAPEFLRARRRLTTLWKRAGTPAQLDALYRRERQAQCEKYGLVVGYVSLLHKAGRAAEAATILRQEVAQSDDQIFLERARRLFAEIEDTGGERFTLKRLAGVAPSPRASISYALRLAASYGEAGERDAAAATLGALVRRYPSNYGVLDEAANFYWRLGLRDDALRILERGRARGRGRYRYTFARRLAARQIELERLDAARRVLEELRAADPLDLEVFRELARLHVRTGDRTALRETFRDTLEALRRQDLDIKEIRAQISELRGALVVAFTQLKDYAAAMEQHIEIVNREPEDEAKLDAAIAYARRYGGGPQLVAHYQRIAKESYKNYRWNVVLARLHEATGDLSNAAREYRNAIGNQPETVELYDALAAVELRAQNYDAALAALGKASELTNDDPQFVKRAIEVLERAGRTREAAEARAKLPAETTETAAGRSVGEQFGEAANPRAGGEPQSVARYREAFAAFRANPFRHELRASEITGYVRALRREESLHTILERLWELRAQLTQEAARAGSADAGKARALLQTLDGALPEAVGTLAAERGDGDELAAIYRDLQERIDATLHTPEQFGTLALLENLAHRIGFRALSEKILRARLDAAHAAGDAALHHTHLRALVALYDASGDYPRAIELLEREQARDAARREFEYARLIAGHARLTGDDERELKALASYYAEPRASNATDAAAAFARTDPLVERYFEALHERGAQGLETLRRLASEPSPYSLQLINFLLARGEGTLAREAVERSALPPVWKLARGAQLCLALKEFDAQAEGYFARALQLKTIGELVSQKPQADARLDGDEWFQLAADYGRWLALAGRAGDEPRARAMLPAHVENRPHDANAQAKLGGWYLSRGDGARALAHLELAREMRPDALEFIADAGAAHFLRGEKERAFEHWSKLVAGDSPTPAACRLYLQTLARHGLAGEARARLFPVLVKRLTAAEEADENGKAFEPTRQLLHALARSFSVTPGSADIQTQEPSETAATLTPAEARAQADFMLKLSRGVAQGTRLPELLLSEKLVARAHAGEFYRMLVERSEALRGYDYDYSFVAALNNSLDPSGVEESLDHENNFQVTEPDNERLKWERDYLEFLLDAGRSAEASRLVAAVETELRGRYARPEWLRLAAVRLDLRAGRDAQAFAELKRFAGIEPRGSLRVVAPPSPERLTAAVALLASERRAGAANALREAAYVRYLALEQYEGAYLEALARLAFERGERVHALKLLRLLCDLARPETRDAAASEIAALPAVAAAAVDAAGSDAPEARDELDHAEALRLAADASATFGEFAPAADWRRELQRVAPDDEANRIELARLLAAGGNLAEATAQLAALIGDRNATRDARWRALHLAPHLAPGATEGRAQFWAALVEQVGASNPSDSEMLTALKARELASDGRAEDALRHLSTIAERNPNPHLKFFQGVLAADAGQDALALECFAAARSVEARASLPAPSGEGDDGPQRRLIRLYLKQGRTRAALRLAATDPTLDVKAETREGSHETNDAGQTDEANGLDEARATSETNQLDEANETNEPHGPNRTNETNRTADVNQANEVNRANEANQVNRAYETSRANQANEVNRGNEAQRAGSSGAGESNVSTRGGVRAPVFLTLDALGAARRVASTLELLELLSKAAEDIGDLDAAVEYERRRLALAGRNGVGDRPRDGRFARLQARQRARTAKPSVGYALDRKTLSQG
jgi:tetratricopeptide (TPR) repeat protein